MPNEKKIPTVRKYISPQDSASVTDYLINLYKNQNVKLPKGISYKDIPDIYSKNVANIPIKFSDLKDKGLKGQYRRYPVKKGNEYAHDAINKEILLDSLVGATWGDYNEKTSILRNWKNTLIHEAFGHALPEAIFGYKPKGTKGSSLSGRSEPLAYLLQAVSNTGKTKASLGKPNTIPVKYPSGTSFETINKDAINNLKNIFVEELSSQKEENNSILDKIKNWFSY